MQRSLSRRQLWIGAIVLFVIIALTILLAPTARTTSGSSYARSPDGYGAWFTYMQQQGFTIERWQRPSSDLTRNHSGSPQTFVQIYDRPTNPLALREFESWVQQGNRLVVLGQWGNATDAPFSSWHNSDAGMLKIETTRRIRPSQWLSMQSSRSMQSILSDRYGEIVWKSVLGSGEIIYINTPYLAANAYQDIPTNFAFLANLVSQGHPRDRIYMDEYLHGYKDRQVVRQERRGDLVGYLVLTPVLLLAVQAGVIVAVAIYGQNRRFGSFLRLPSAKSNNSQAYIQALAGVLQKANCSDFLLDVIGKAEQTHLQQQLGQGRQTCTPEQLIAAWDEQVQQPHTTLQQVLQFQQRKRRVNDRALIQWLHQLASLRKTFEKGSIAHPSNPSHLDES